jgi:SPX domain protein involved in polyphosphate accumulation
LLKIFFVERKKVYAFHKATMNRIQEEVDNCETAISTQLPSQDSANELAQLQSKINNIADDINRLERFIRFNYTGFLKIVKKHDRHTDYILRPMFMVRLNQCPFWREDNEQLLIKLSSLFNQARGGGRTMSFRPTNFRPQDVPEVGVDSSRTLVKRFFVHTDDVLELKTSVLRHLPALIYKESDKSNDKDDIDPPISSLYLDDSDMDSYSSRVESAPASQIIRLRWYGSVNGNRSISVERRTLEDENRGDLKDRFIIKDKYVEGFITGDQTFLEKTVNKMKQSGTRSDQEIHVYSNLVKEVQKTIVDKHMQPGKAKPKKKEKEKRKVFSGILYK